MPTLPHSTPAWTGLSLISFRPRSAARELASRMRRTGFRARHPMPASPHEDSHAQHQDRRLKKSTDFKMK